MVALMATHINSEDCQGNPQQYWSATRTDDSGHIIIGNGPTEEIAEALVEKRLQERNDFLSTSPEHQLKVFTDKKEMSLRDVKDSVKLIAQILLDANE